MINKKIQIVSWIILAIILAIFPKVFSTYYTNLFVTFAVFATFSVSLNVLLGYTGSLSFGHAIFFGAGGYATALALKHISGLSLLSALGLGILSAVILAVVLSLLVCRLNGTAFTMVHLAFGQFFYVIVIKLRNITGGEDGIGNFPIPPFNISGLISIQIKNSPDNFYYFALIILGISVLLMWFLTKTPFGQIQTAIRDNEKRVDYLGFKVQHSKAIIYIISGTFAGVAGSVYALFHNQVSADGSLGLMISIIPLINIMVGGMGSFAGPILGTAVFQIIEELVLRLTDKVELLIGLTLVVVIMFAPNGLTGLITTLKLRWKGTQAKLKLEEK